MSNRDLKDRKLQPHQRVIWRKAFEASMQHTSIEAAEKKAWQVVDIWERVGAFHESQAPQPTEPKTFPFSDETWKSMWKSVARGVAYWRGASEGWETEVAELASQFLRGDLSFEEFDEEVESACEER